MKRLAVLLISALLIMLGGCKSGMLYADMREIDQLELIQTVGLDASDSGVRATAASGMRVGGGSPTVLENTSPTTARAMRLMQNYSSKKYVFYGHVRYLLIGEEAAREGLGKYLDYVERSVELRLSTGLLIVKGGTANELIRLTSTESESTAELLASLEKDVRLMSESRVGSCGEAAESLAESGTALVAAVSPEQGENGWRIASAGYTVFKDGRLAAYIDTDTARAVNLLTGEVEGDVTELPDGRGGCAALRVTSGKSSLGAEFSGGELIRITIDARVTANIEELGESCDPYSPAEIAALEAKLAALEKARIDRALSLMSELGCDYLGIGAKLRRAHPLKTDRLGGRLAESIAGAETEVRVEAKIERTYDLGAPLRTDGGDG
jgi:spore germination protein KC